MPTDHVDDTAAASAADDFYGAEVDRAFGPRVVNAFSQIRLGRRARRRQESVGSAFRGGGLLVACQQHMV
jgi:hypothetical protein